MARPLHGKVMLEDGTPPGEPATIERVCNGQPFPETYTDGKGRFSFYLGQNPSRAFADASVPLTEGLGGQSIDQSRIPNMDLGGGRSRVPGRVDLTGCEVRASLAGYRSEPIRLGYRSTFDDPNLGVIILHRLARGEGVSISATSLRSPKKAQKAYQKALRELRKTDASSRKLGKAIKELEKAVEEYPQYASAWNLLGRTRLSINDRAGVREAFEKAIEADPKYLGPYVSLLRMEVEERRWERVIEVADRLLRLNPQMTDVQFHRAAANFNLANVAMAEKLALNIQSGKDAEKFPQTHHLLGMIQAKNGEFVRAATEYQNYLSAQPLGPAAKELRRQLVEWEALGVIKKADMAAVTNSAK